MNINLTDDDFNLLLTISILTVLFYFAYFALFGRCTLRALRLALNPRTGLDPEDRCPGLHCCGEAHVTLLKCWSLWVR